MSKSTKTPGMRRIVSALKRHGPKRGPMIPDEVAPLANVALNTVESYMAPLVRDELIHVAGQRPSVKFSGLTRKEYLAGPDSVARVQMPRHVPFDPITAALLGGRQQGVSA